MGLLEDFSAWLDNKKRQIVTNASDPALLYTRANEDARKFQREELENWGLLKSVMPEVKQAAQKQVWDSGMELAGLEPMGILGTFAGVGAKTADVVKLAKAKEMAKAGADPVEVWKQTGWTDQFPDGKWRFEISDDKSVPLPIKNASLDDLNRGNSTVEALSTVFRHPELGKAYPGTTAGFDDQGNRVVARILPGGGESASYSNGRIEVRDVTSLDGSKKIQRSPTLHELQHYVQDKENFSRGGSPQEFSVPTGKVAAEIDRINERLSALAKERDLLRQQPVGTQTAADYKRWFDSEREYQELLDKRLKLVKESTANPFKQYQSLAGEAEARLTQSRMNLTPAERAARPPWLEFDVPPDQQIVRGLLGEPTGPAMSVGPSKQRGIIGDWRWKGADKVKQEVGINELPQYIADNYGQFMKEQRGRADAGQLGTSDLLKAYGITRSSVNRGAREISDDLAQGSVRPEGYMAEWLLSPQGKAYLDAAEKGQVNAEAIADIKKRFAPFGMADTLANDLAYAAQQLAPINGSVNAAVTGPVDQWRTFARGLNGIGPAKSGFIASLLGRGDLPTLDARQLALHTGKPAKEASKYMRRAGGKGGDAAVDRLAERQKAMGVAVDESLNPFYQHLTHHAVWDKVGGTQTTHEDLIRAMKMAGIGGFGLLGAGAYGQEQ